MIVEIRESTSNQSGASTAPGVSQSEVKRVYPRSTSTHTASTMICKSSLCQRRNMGVYGGKTDEGDDELVNVSGF